MNKLLLTFILFTSTNSVIARQICEAGTESNQNELAMKEKDFSFEEAMSSVEWLEKEFPKTLSKYKDTSEVLGSHELYSIPYNNTLSTIRGTLLRQKVLIEIEKLKLIKNKYKEGKVKKSTLDLAKIRFNDTKKVLCDFVSNAEYID